MSIVVQRDSSGQVKDSVASLVDSWNLPVDPADALWWAAENPDHHADRSPGVPVLPFAEWLGMQAAMYRSMESDAADWLAGKIDELAAECRFLRAGCPAEFDVRRDIQELWAAGSQGGGR